MNCPRCDLPARHSTYTECWIALREALAAERAANNRLRDELAAAKENMQRVMDTRIETLMKSLEREDKLMGGVRRS